MDKRKDKNVLKRKGFVVTDITNNNISDCQSSNQKSTNRVNNRLNALKKNRFVVKDIDNSVRSNINNRNIMNQDIKVSEKSDNFEKIEGIECHVNNCSEINETIEDITDCQVIDSEDNNTYIKCEVISEQCDQRNKAIVGENIDNSLRNKLFESKTLLSDSRLHTELRFKAKYMNKKSLKEFCERNNLILDRSRLRKDEYIILKRNWDKFCDDYQINDEMKVFLLGFFRRTKRYTKEEKKQMNRFIESTNFYLRLAKDLPTRDLDIVMNAAKRRFCPLKRVIDLTDNEKNLMRNLYRIFKEKWSVIAEKINCNPKCVHPNVIYYFDKNGEPYKKGRWSWA